MAQFLLPAALGLPGFIGGIISAVEAGKRLRGGRLVRYRPRRKIGGKVRRKRTYKRGRGIAADIASSLPLIGAIAGPLVRALGGRMARGRYTKKRGRGLVPLKIYQPIAYGAGLLGPGAYRPAIYGSQAMVPYRSKRGGATTGILSADVGRALTRDGLVKESYPGMGKHLLRMLTYGGLLSPTGVGGAAKKGHYRHLASGKRVYVRPARMRIGGAAMRRAPKKSLRYCR